MMRDILLASGLVGVLLGVCLLVVMLAPHPEPKLVLMPSAPAVVIRTVPAGREAMLRAFERAHRLAIIKLERRLGLPQDGVISAALLNAVAGLIP